MRSTSAPSTPAGNRPPLWLRTGSWATRRFASLNRVHQWLLAMRNRWLTPGIVRRRGSGRRRFAAGGGLWR